MTTTRFSRKSLTLATLAVMLGANLPGAQASAQPTVQEQTSYLPGRQITPADEAVISTSAVKVLRHVAEARGRLRQDKPDADGAKSELLQANKLLDIIKASLPTTEVKDRIWVARKHLEYEDTREVLPDLIPIYTSLTELVDYLPTANAKGHIDEAKKAMEEGKKERAQEQLRAADDALLYVEADLPLNSTRALVNQALDALTANDSKAADQALMSAEDNVVFVSVSMESPLVQAKWALTRARDDYFAGDRDLAKADLDQAVKYLGRAAESGDKVAREGVQSLIGDLRDLSSMVRQDDKDVGQRFEQAWHRSKALSERAAEYVSTGWQRLRGAGEAKKELIDAKLQLSYARIDHAIGKDNAAAKVELAEAKGLLDSAGKAIGEAQRPALDSLIQQVEGLQAALNQDRADLNFDTVQLRLGRLIADL